MNDHLPFDLGWRGTAERVPSTKWDAFKLKRFPSWLLKRFPVRYNLVNVKIEAVSMLPKSTSIHREV